MSELKMTQVTWWKVWEASFSEFVSEYYQRPYRLQQQGEMMGQNTFVNETVGSYDWDEVGVASAEEEMAEWLAVDHTAYKYRFEFEREHYPSLEVVLWDLYRKGAIPAGTYHIYCWW